MVIRLKFTKEDIDLYVRFTKASCDILGIRHVKIFFIIDNNMYDEKLNNVNELIAKVDTYEIDFGQHNIYINLDTISKQILIIEKILYMSRKVYQYCKIFRTNVKEDIAIEHDYVLQWTLNITNKNPYKDNEQPIEIDAHAYVYYMMKVIFNIELNPISIDKSFIVKQSDIIKISIPPKRITRIIEEWGII